MAIEDLEEQLRKLGYDRENNDYNIDDGEIRDEDYTSKTLNHTFLENCRVINTKFDNASATGSIYNYCDFINCSIIQTDFEYCEFYNCTFETPIEMIASFNNSNFNNVNFNNLHLKYSTFTGTYFEGCNFFNVKIEDSTFENAILKNCTFKNMDLGNLNLDYVQLDSPKMKDVILPFSQIPYMFGCLEYLLLTDDKIFISSNKNATISKEKYLEEIIPLLIDFWNSKKRENSEYYFPLSNVYLAKKDYINAVGNLREGLKNAVTKQDYRMIKFYCKIISESNMFNFRTLYNFLNLIKRVGNYNENINQSESRNFIRNIGEIESILFSANKKGAILLSFRTNISTHDVQKIGIVIEKLFTIAKMNHALKPNNVEMILAENSPLLITLRVNGEKESLVELLVSVLKVDNNINEKFFSNHIYMDIATNKLCNTDNLLIDETNNFCNICLQSNIKILLIEYYIENCQYLLPKNIASVYYLENSMIEYWDKENHLIENKNISNNKW